MNRTLYVLNIQTSDHPHRDRDIAIFTDRRLAEQMGEACGRRYAIIEMPLDPPFSVVRELARDA